ncbi:MAG TPA: amidohydrolase family protein [Jatrophihabitans sp.]|jgi:N-acyl-D-aspartate/D-glutamate deacylase
MLDLAVRGGELVDGTGAPRWRADVGISGGRVVALGDVGAARQEVDATGLIVAPGFCDVHTHIDAQVFWDTSLTPSSLHGVTTVLAGNCGFTLAPLIPDATSYLVEMLSVVEGMPLAALRASVPGDWTGTAEYLDRIEGTLSLNAGFLVGHSALRRVVMGLAATQRAATPEERHAMQRLLREGLDAGGLGFSSSWGPAHFDNAGSAIPSRHATPDELIALAAVCRDVEGTSIEFAPARADVFDDAQLQLTTSMSAAAGRPLNWNVLRVTENSLDDARSLLEAGSYARRNGGDIVALTMPINSRARFSFGTGFVLDSLPSWGPVMALPLGERIAALRDPQVRSRLAEGARSAVGPAREIAEFSERIIDQTFSADTSHYRGRRVADIAREEGKDPFDALLDIACADELRTTFTRDQADPTAEDWRAAVEVWRDDRALIGASDAGAHLDFTAYFDYPTYVLDHAVRRHRALPLEEAVHLMTEAPARLYGIRDRGVVAEGTWADLVVFDEATVASGAIETRFDLPTGAGRLYSEPSGIHQVLVNGEVVVSGGKATDVRPGHVLRSGRDTRTPALH